MGVIGTRVYLQFFEHGPTQGVFGQHAFHCGLQNTLRGLLTQDCQRGSLQPTWKPSVVVVQLAGFFVTRYMDLFCIDDHNVITGIHVGGVFGLVLAPQATSDLCCQAPKHLVIGVNQEPFPSDVVCFC